MALDTRGDISVVTVIVYIPILILAFVLTIRHGFGRQAGWVYLVVFSVVRIAGGASFVTAEKESHPSATLISTAFALESAGIAPLLLCTTGFLQTVSSLALTELSFARPKFLRFLRLAVTGGFILALVGGINANSAVNNSSEKSKARTIRKIGALVLVGCYGVIFFIHFLLWSNKSQLLRYRRTLLLAISCALPFLAVRVLYSALSAFSPPITISPDGELINATTGLAKFNSIVGEWQIYLVMALLMELATVAIYICFGIGLPLKKDEIAVGYGSPASDQGRLYNGAYPLSQRGP